MDSEGAEFILKPCGDRLESVVVRDAHVEIETQIDFPAGDMSACCIDMIFTRNSVAAAYVRFAGLPNRRAAEVTSW
jgi:hypothetical protein